MHSRIISIFSIMAVISCLVVINTTDAFAAKKEDRRIIAEIGNEKIYFSDIELATKGLNKYLKENFEKSKDWRLNYVRQYIAQVALAKRAKKERVDKDKAIIYKIKKTEESILAEKLLTDALSKVSVPKETSEQYYQENKARYQIPEKIKISYVEFKTKKSAAKVISRLNKGDTFARAAGNKIIKIDEWVQRGMPGIPGLEGISSSIIDQICSLGVGGSSSIIEAGDLFYIFHIEKKESSEEKPFDEIKEQVQSEYMRLKKEKVINDFILETFEKENVKIYDDNIIEDMN